MDNINTLFAQYSAVEIVVLLILIGTSIKFISELLDWFIKKARIYFNKEYSSEITQTNLIEKIDEVSLKIDSLSNQISNLEQRVDKTEKSINSLKDKVHDLGNTVNKLDHQIKKTDENVKIVQERLQNQTKSRLIELHHKYMYEYQMIDDIGLQSMEREYLYYKAAGGNTFIDTLMEEVRALPRPTLEGNLKINHTHLMYDENV